MPRPPTKKKPARKQSKKHGTAHSAPKRVAALPLMVKRSVTLERSWDEAAHALVGDRGFSELVNDAVKRAVQRLLFEQDLVAHEAEHGPISRDAWARAEAQVTKYLKRNG